MSGAFVGFGFGPIQAGLFLCEAALSRKFSRLVVAEILEHTVAAVRKSGGAYALNIATPSGIKTRVVEQVEIFNPRIDRDREALIEAVGEASELATALPSVKAYGSGLKGDPVDILGRGLARKFEDLSLPQAVIYTGENHNHAAEILEQALMSSFSLHGNSRFQILNTVIGKMSGVVTDPVQIAEQNLAPVTGDASKAFLVEEFNSILISRITLKGFCRGIMAFEEKDDLLPFEEAKLYGHNAVHALMGYILRLRGVAYMAEAVSHPDILKLAREAFLEESGRALCAKYAGLDPLFTPSGFAAYADDLIRRMLNPHLRDSVARVTRDPVRKLGWEDRLVGTMRLALARAIKPFRFAIGAAAALRALADEQKESEENILRQLWNDPNIDSREAGQIRSLVAAGLQKLNAGFALRSRL